MCVEAEVPTAPALRGALLGRHQDPIVAIASAPGRGAVGIVRASGRDLAPLIQALCGRALLPRQATLLPFLDDEGSALDRGLALHFPAPHSYTGEDVLELQAHGGPVLLQLLVARCLQAQPGLRLAAPGEFTERAFLNDKIDLAQAEAVADLIDASTEAAAKSAARSLGGAFSDEVKALAGRIVRLRMLVEATLDFPEEEIDFLEKAGARGQLDAIEAAVQTSLQRARQGALLRDGLRVVLAGLPNVGKSSLMNALAGAELSIVTPIAGTTRDRVAQSIQIDGVPLHITDTAGLRHDIDAADEVERIGIGRSWQSIQSADVVVFLHDLVRLTEPGYAQAEALVAAQLPAGVPVLQVFNKADVAGGRMPQQSAGTTAGNKGDGDTAAEVGICLSAHTGQGLNDLRRALLQQAGWQAAPEGLLIARARHVQALHLCQQHLVVAQQHAAVRDAALDLLAEELRLAHQALAQITGEFSNEDLLGEIFSKFCIGK
jgi:tRNA modification GTPase